MPHCLTCTRHTSDKGGEEAGDRGGDGAGKKKRGGEKTGQGWGFVPQRAVKEPVILFNPSIVPQAHKSDITLSSG